MSRKLIKKFPIAVLKNAQVKLDEVFVMLRPYLIVLSQPERQTLVKMEAKSFKFIELSHEIAYGNPELFPDFVKLTIFEEEFIIAMELIALGNKLNQLKSFMNDTEVTAGNHALEAAFSFYQLVKIAERRDIPGASVSYEELKPSRPSGNKKKKRRKAVKDERQLELFEN